MLNGNLCPLCVKTEGSVEHLFLACSRVGLAWKDMMRWLTDVATDETMEVDVSADDSSVLLLVQVKDRS